MRKKTTKPGLSQVLHIADARFSLPRGFELEFDREPDGRFLAVIEKVPGVMAYGNTRNEAAIHAIELLVNVLAERVRDFDERERVTTK